MLKKFSLWAAGTAGAVGTMAVAALGHAQTIGAGVLAVPTSTASDLLASVSNTFTDAGVLAFVVIAVAIPLAFYVLHQLIGLIPKSRSRKQ